MKKLLFLLMFPVLCFGQTADEFYNSGLDKGNLEDYNGAIADFTKAIELNPDDADTYYNRGTTKVKLKDYNGAIADFTKAISLKPFADCYVNRGHCKADLEDYEGAIADFTKAIELNPNDESAYYQRGGAKLFTNESSCPDMKKACELGSELGCGFSEKFCISFGQTASYFLESGNAKKNLKDYEGAIADYTKAISLNPDYANAYNNRGICKEILGQPYCSDWKKGCELGNQNCCEWYNNQCR
tara:strand:- start:17 stop:745 length:729 start_codon:yes stop_codon:yes gene_type:complete